MGSALQPTPGRIRLTGRGRLLVEPPRDGLAAYCHEKKRSRPSERRIIKWQELRHWQGRRAELRPQDMHAGRPLLRAKHRARLPKYSPPLLTAKEGEFSCRYTAPLLQVIVFACLVRGRGHLLATNGELAALLGCHPRTVYTATREAADQGLLLITAMFSKAGEGAPCRCGHDHGPQGPCPACGCERHRALQHMQMANAYAPGPVLRMMWQHWQDAQPPDVDHKDRFFAQPSARSLDPDPSPYPLPAPVPARSEKLPRPVPPGQPPQPAALPQGAPAKDRGQARPAGASQLRAEGARPVALGSRGAGLAGLIEAGCKMRASDGARVSAAAPAPDLATEVIAAAVLGDGTGTPAAWLQRLGLFLELRDRGAPPAEACAALERHSDSAPAEEGRAGVVCPRQGDPP